MIWFTNLFKKKVHLTEEEINATMPEESLKWNKMWDLWVDGELEQPISSLLTYEGEIKNGGHLQFFCNLEGEENQLNDVLKQLKRYCQKSFILI